ncbi:MAG: Mur ligase family protein [Planctomycetota bacterium]|jgi:UDP-N-acetylmuramoylalanine--D-glutamate ligase
MHDDLRGLHVTVMGLGRFGGGAGVAAWLADEGARVVVTDLLEPQSLAGSLEPLAGHVAAGAIELHLGGHDPADFTACDLVVANPAVPTPWENRYLAAAAAAGVAVTTEIRLLTERLERGRVIGVTGTAGKSTTTAMIHHVLVRAGRAAHLGGNIGGSLLSNLGTIEPDHWVVLELSSAMLYWLGAGVGHRDQPGWSPHVATMTNLQPNHLDWHATFEHYADCKQGIFRYQAPGDHALTAGDLKAEMPIRLAIPGRHNQDNARLAIAAACAAADLDPGQAAEALGDFPGLAHRLQLVAEHGSLRFYNDSKATTPEATCLAVDAFDNASAVHVLAGGYDKKVDLSSIVELAPRVAGLYTIGTTGRRLADAVAGNGHAEFCETLEAAAARALGRMSTGDVLLLSPGCASWDQFDNYEQRGNAFRSWVQAHVSGA